MVKQVFLFDIFLFHFIRFLFHDIPDIEEILVEAEILKNWL